MELSPQTEFRCRECGAALAFDPGTQSLKCSHCGALNQITGATGSVDEFDFVAELQRLREEEPTHEKLTCKCSGCSAEVAFPPDVAATTCPFCGSPLSAAASSKKAIQPRAILPFAVTCEQATAAFQNWVASLWFAPSQLKDRAQRSAIHGTYIPAWTYDSNTQSDYTGQRGEHYYDTETYTETENGQTVTRTRQVQRTRWWPVSGVVHNQFNDLLVMASLSLPQKLLVNLEPWDLPRLVPYADGYLTGFITESYQVNLEHGFDVARQMMDDPIHRTILRDIGGDEQRISSVNTQYFDVRFRHLLLPVWISAYRYQDRIFRFMVNARTGEVQGERPYSSVKIALLVLVIVLLVAAVILLSQR